MPTPRRTRRHSSRSPASVLLSWLLMVSQAMESTTRAFYSRSDLDLILASPAAAEKVFAVRIATVALSMAMMAVPLAAPFIDVLIALGGWRWLGAYGLIVAMGAAATALAVGLTVALFRLVGPKRTPARRASRRRGDRRRLSSSACNWRRSCPMGRSRGSRSLQSQTAIALAPDAGSIFWWPARAALGDGTALVGVLALSLCLARRRHRHGRAALWRIRRHRRGLAALRRSIQARRSTDFRPTVATARAAPQGMDAVAARSLAGFADAHADALSHSARGSAVAQLQ